MPTPHSDEAAPRSPVDRLGRVRRGAAAAVERTAHWAAIALPFLSAAVLFTGVETRVELAVLLALLAVNGLAIAAVGLTDGER